MNLTGCMGGAPCVSLGPKMRASLCAHLVALGSFGVSVSSSRLTLQEVFTVPVGSPAKDDVHSIWLASYPRSGNTFMRLLLQEALGLRTSSVYAEETWKVTRLFAGVGRYGERDPGDEGPGGNGHPSTDWQTKPAAQHLSIVKTHEAPLDSGPAIFVVRDGRSCCVSHFHFLTDFHYKSITLEDIVMGKVWPGSWSDHFREWNPIRRPNTLLVRYEHLKNSTASVCTEISEFLQVPEIGKFDLRFADLHNFCPEFFRCGDDARNIAEMGPYQELFDSFHGDLMRELHYY